MDLQCELDAVYKELCDRLIDRGTYVERIDRLAESISEDVVRKFLYRKDGRTLGEFALALYDNTQRERFLMEACWPHIGEGIGVYRDLGIANDGRLILDTRGRGGHLDFLVELDFGTSYPLEIKFAPTQRFLTYKIADVENYLATAHARVLTVASPASMLGPNGDKNSDATFVLHKDSWFTLMDHEALENLLEYGERDRHRGFGGKPTVRLFERDFHLVSRPTKAIQEAECPTA